jgi:membrane fusion protein (multidrug efflux system)
VFFRVAALGERDFSGIVDFVDPVVALPARTITVKAQVPNPRRELAAGMFLEARLRTDLRPNAVVIPEDAVSPMQGEMWVWVVSGGRADRRQVTLGIRNPGVVEIKDGIQPGDQVVVGGAERLTPGAAVQIIEHARGTPADTGAQGRPAVGDTGRASPDSTDRPQR